MWCECRAVLDGGYGKLWLMACATATFYTKYLYADAGHGDDDDDADDGGDGHDGEEDDDEDDNDSKADDYDGGDGDDEPLQAQQQTMR